MSVTNFSISRFQYLEDFDIKFELLGQNNDKLVEL